MDASKQSSDNVPSAAPSGIECQTPVDLEQSRFDAQEILQAEALDPPWYELLLLQHSSELINCVLTSYHVAVCQLRVMLNRLSRPVYTMPVHSCSIPGKRKSYDKTVTQRAVQLGMTGGCECHVNKHDKCLQCRDTLLELRNKPECQSPPKDWDLSHSRYVGIGYANEHTPCWHVPLVESCGMFAVSFLSQATRCKLKAVLHMQSTASLGQMWKCLRNKGKIAGVASLHQQTSRKAKCCQMLKC